MPARTGLDIEGWARQPGACGHGAMLAVPRSPSARAATGVVYRGGSQRRSGRGDPDETNVNSHHCWVGREFVGGVTASRTAAHCPRVTASHIKRLRCYFCRVDRSVRQNSFRFLFGLSADVVTAHQAPLVGLGRRPVTARTRPRRSGRSRTVSRADRPSRPSVRPIRRRPWGRAARRSP